jgi:hypothetical protein
MDVRWDSRNTTLNGLKPLAQRVSYPFSHMPDSIFAQPAPHRHSSSQRERARRTHPHHHGARRYASRAAGRSERIPQTLWRIGTAPLACTSARACSHKGTVHTQPAVASRRCPPSWPPHERPWPELRVADTRRWRPHRTGGAMYARQTDGRPPCTTPHMEPESPWTSHTHTCPRASTSC